jgi:hypothetical protein
VLAAVLVAGGLLAARALSSKASTSGGVQDNSAASALATVTRQDLSAQTQV